MTKHEDNLINVLKGALKGRDNPIDLKPVYIGKIVNLSPIKVSIFDGKVILTEDDDLYISEQFRLRCEIDKTFDLSLNVPNLLTQAMSVQEIHSFTQLPCNIPQAIEFLAQAITKVSTEVLNLKCDLKIGDFVAVASLEQLDVYLLTDKVT
jgi:hypothetical protein